MKIQKVITAQGDWAKVGEDFKDGDLIKIMDEGTIVEGEFGARKVFKIAFKGREGTKNLSFNQTSLNNLVDGFGEDTKDWITQIENRLHDLNYYLKRTDAWLAEHNIDDDKIIVICCVLTCIWVSNMRNEHISFLESYAFLVSSYY